MEHSETATKLHKGTHYCSHCGESSKEKLGRRHHNEDDTYYCTCPGAIEEGVLQIEKSGLKNKLYHIERKIEELVKQSEPTLNAKMYELENTELKRKYSIQD
jgi:hypothetical protein